MITEWMRSKENSQAEGTHDWKRKSKYLLVILGCVGILALIWPVTNTSNNSSVSVPAPVYTKGEVDDVRTQMAEELESILSQIEGAGKVSVSLSLSSDGIKTYAANIREEKKDLEDISGGNKKITSEASISRDIAVNSGNALLVEHKNPEVVGVLIVAEGAGNPKVKENLTYAASTLLDIPVHKVRVMPREGD